MIYPTDLWTYESKKKNNISKISTGSRTPIKMDRTAIWAENTVMDKSWLKQS
jgi:hypothetical protein